MHVFDTCIRHTRSGSHYPPSDQSVNQSINQSLCCPVSKESHAMTRLASPCHAMPCRILDGKQAMPRPNRAKPRSFLPCAYPCRISSRFTTESLPLVYFHVAIFQTPWTLRQHRPVSVKDSRSERHPSTLARNANWYNISTVHLHLLYSLFAFF